MLHICLICLIGCILIEAARIPRQIGPCKTRSGDIRQGICINIRKCPTLMDFLNDNRSKHGNLSILKKLTCGFEDNDPMVCCPTLPQLRSTGLSILPSPPSCGTSNNDNFIRVIGGQPASLGSWPWIAALGYKSKTKKPNWKCGGVLINDRFVLTAGHCLTEPGFVVDKVRLGDLDLNDFIDDGATPVDYLVEKAIVLPENNRATNQHDIGLVKLKTSVQFTKFIQPICLPKSDQLRSQSFEDRSPFVIGWGTVKYESRFSEKNVHTTRLQELQIPVVESEVCRRWYARIQKKITDSQICAGEEEGGKDSCQGDSGGPLMVPVGNKWFVIGIVSFGRECAKAEYPGVYTRVTSYIDWIESEVRKG